MLHRCYCYMTHSISWSQNIKCARSISCLSLLRFRKMIIRLGSSCLWAAEMSARVLRRSAMRRVYNTPLKHNRACREALAFVETVIKRFAFLPLFLWHSFLVFILSVSIWVSTFLGPVSLSASLLKLSCLQLSLTLPLSLYWKVPSALGVMGSRHATCSCVTTWERAEWRSEEIMRTSVLSDAASCCSQIKDQLYCSPHWSTTAAQSPYLDAHSFIHSPNDLYCIFTCMYPFMYPMLILLLSPSFIYWGLAFIIC